MRVLSNQQHPDGIIHTIVERTSDEDLLAYSTDGFYRIQGCIFSGHDVGCMERVAWDAVAQEWKVVKP